MKYLNIPTETKGDKIKSKVWNSVRSFIPVLVVIFSLFEVKTEAQICCPQFKLQDAVEICPPEGACKGHASTGGTGNTMAACKLTIHEYTVYPNDPGFTYTWTITGGTAANPTVNPVDVLWGSGSVGYIKVVMSNLGIGGYCKDSIIQEICLIDGPKANFNLSPSIVCSNSPVHFTNTSGGGSSYLWDFGDGSTSILANPPDHSYTLPGTYTVTLTASNGSASQQAPDLRPPCGCTDKISKIITVLNGAGPTIDVNCCYGTVCAGDTSSFCTSTVCTTYNWSVTGGTIISGAGTTCIKVKWNNTYSVPTTVSLAVPGCASAPCAGTTTLNVPVLYPNFPINGPNTLCVGASGSFFLPSMPGTYYLWTTTAPPLTFSFNDKNKNTANVNISFTLPGTYLLQCQYNNPMAGCSGMSVIAINVLPVFSIQGDETTCQGDTVTYTASGMATWAVTPTGATVPAGPSVSSNIIWNLPGTYTITATNTTPGVFCNPTAVKVVQVVAKPILGSITGTLFACPGKNFTFGITSNKQGSPFVWTASGGGTVMSQMGADRDSAVIKLNGSGPWTISVYQKIEISPGNYCQSLTKTLVVNPYSAPVVTGNGNVCVDAIETYTASGPVPPGGIQWIISPSYQGTIIFQGSNTVNIRWHGTPNSATVTASHCGGSGTKTVTILNPPIVAPISSSGPLGYCLPNMPINLSLSTTSGFFSYQWYLNNSLIGGANAFSYNIPNATFTGLGTYYFSVAVSNGSCTILKTTYIYIDSCAGGGSGTPTNPVPCTIDFTINPNPACENQPVTFTAVPGGAGFTFAWDFGDNATSFQSPTEHAYVSAGTDTVTLTATIGTCIVVVKKVVTVNPTPSCIITASDTAFCPGNFVTLYACTGMSSYQWYKNGNLIIGATGATYNAGQHGEYQVEVTNGFGCANKSNSIYIYQKTPPIAHITGDGLVCAYPAGFTSFPLSAYYDSNYSYDWSTNAPGASFSPNNSNSANSTGASFTLPGILPVTYYFVVKVTDVITTCESWDTLCVTFFETPPLTMPYFAACQAGPVTFTPNLINPVKYKYHWSNGKTTPTITVAAPGSYSLTITDKSSGCSATALAGVIYPKPDLSLFPHGCDSIMCKTDTLHMYIPLPLSFYPPFNTYSTAYQSIKWYDNGNYVTPIASGQNFNFVAPASGSHQISVIVKTNNGCADTAGVYCLTVICGDIQLNCPSGPIILPCNSPNPTTADALAAVGAITDSCPGPINITVTGGTAMPISGCLWKSVFTIMASNGCGQADTCLVTYQWKKDTEPPVFSKCPNGPITLPCNAPHPTIANALAIVGSVTDNCPGTPNVVVTGGAATPLSGCDWTATFTITATDSCNNTSICAVVYNWKEDITPPQFAHCPQGPFNLPCNTKPILGEILYEIGPITDNCPGHIDVQVTGGIPIPSTGCNWTTTYTITATDLCGNINVCTATYNWKEDHVAPVFAHCPNGPILLPCNSPRPKESDAIAAAGAVTDNCPGILDIQVTGGVATPTTGCNWTSTFSITATDSCGNSTSCAITYNWKEDLVPPQFAHCPQGPVNLPCNSKPILGEILYEIGPITDNCPGHIDVQVTGGIPIPATGCNWTATYTITATDSCGNTNVCTATYNWKEDHVAPVFAHCPNGPILLPCNSPRPKEADAIAAAGVVTDNCSDNVNVQVTGGLVIPIEGCAFSSVFSITATDACGNTAVCVVTFNWKEDNIPPVYAHCPVHPITLPCNAPRPTTNMAVETAGPVIDNCYVDNIQVTDGGVIATTGCWFTETFTLTATDGCGNVTTCHVTYNWKEDQTAPVFAHCPTSAIELPCNAPRPTTAGAIAAAGTVTDNCPGNVFYVNCLVPIDGHYDSPTMVSYGTDIAIRNIVLANFSDCYPLPVAIGQTEIHTYTSVASFELSQNGENNWVPGQAPAAITIKITKTGETETESFFDTEMLTMNISGGTLPQGLQLRESPTLASTGQTSIPKSGKSSTEEYVINSFFDVFTEISTDAGNSWIAAIQPWNVNLTGPVIVHVTPGSITPTANCGFTQTFALTATDACGNTAVCNVSYNWKEDHTPPAYAHCPDGAITLPCNAPRPTTNMAVDAAGPVIDNCYVDNIQVTDGGVIAMTGCWFTETFTLTATDGCGNVTVCHVTYNWREDRVKPTFTRPQDITIYVDDSGNYNASVSVTGDVTNEADNCSTVLNAIFLDEVTSGIPPVWRIIKRTWSLVDDCGNAADDQVQTITVAGTSGVKTLTLSLLLEGLYAGEGSMNQTMDVVDGMSVPKWPTGVADHITVELHNAAIYGTIEYSAPDVALSTNGTAFVTTPGDKNGVYYLTIKHRNSIETTSALPVDFSGATISYAFDKKSKAFGSNMGLMIDGAAVIYAGDENQDKSVDGSDLQDIGNFAEVAAIGYMPQDLTGDGLVDGDDLSIAGNNADYAIGAILP